MDLIASFNAHKIKTSYNQAIETYPCVSHSVSVENAGEIDFYFDFSFQNISLPLLGTSFTDDCAYVHSINGDLIITGMKNSIGAGYYKSCNSLDFDKVMARFELLADV